MTYAQAIEADPAFTTPIATPEEWADITAIHERVSQSGFTTDELAQLSAAGLDSTQIDAMRTHFVLPPEEFDPSQTLPEVVRHLADIMDGAAAGFDTFAREMSAVGARNALDVPPPNTPPTASFTATPSSGRAPLAVAFNASASADAEAPIASYAWDFGDGSTGIGATVNHTYTTAGNYTATLTVTDAGGLTASTTRAVAVSDEGNVPPIAVATATTPAVGPAPLDRLTQRRRSRAMRTARSCRYVWTFPDGSTLNGPVVRDHARGGREPSTSR